MAERVLYNEAAKIAENISNKVTWRLFFFNLAHNREAKTILIGSNLPMLSIETKIYPKSSQVFGNWERSNTNNVSPRGLGLDGWGGTGFCRPASRHTRAQTESTYLSPSCVQWWKM